MLQAIKDAFQSVIDFFYRCFLSLGDFLRDFLWFVLDSLMKVGIAVLETLGTGFAGLNPLQYFNAIPDSTKAMMSMVGFNECISIIVSAILIRFLLQLIPFVRWGS